MVFSSELGNIHITIKYLYGKFKTYVSTCIINFETWLFGNDKGINWKTRVIASQRFLMVRGDYWSGTWAGRRSSEQCNNTDSYVMHEHNSRPCSYELHKQTLKLVRSIIRDNVKKVYLDMVPCLVMQNCRWSNRLRILRRAGTSSRRL